jgi:hypothetical protein
VNDFETVREVLNFDVGTEEALDALDRIEAKVERLTAVEKAAREFHTAWRAVEAGLAEFDLHRDAVDRLESAEQALVTVLGGLPAK